MSNEEYERMLAEELATTGKIHIPHTPPKATKASETDKTLASLPEDARGRLEKYLSILNESGGALVPCLIEEGQKRATPLNLFEILDKICKQEPAGLAILEKAREKLKTLEDPENADLMPYIKAEIKKAKKDPEYNNITIWDIFEAKEAGQSDAEPKDKAALILEKAIKNRELHEQYPLQPTYDIKTQGVIISALANYLQNNEVIGAGAFDLPVLPKQNITTYVNCYFDEDAFPEVKQLTETERAVLDCIYSIGVYTKENNIKCLFDGYTIAALMPGGSKRINENEAIYYNNIIEKLRHLFIHIDATSEMQARGKLKEDETLILDDYCISAVGAKYRTRRGDIKPGYLLRDIPLTHAYAEQTGQIIKISSDLFEIKETTTAGSSDNKPVLLDSNIKMTQTRRDIVAYLLRRIYIIKGDYKKAKDAYRQHEKKRKYQEQNGRPVDDFKPLESYRSQSKYIKFSTLFEKSGITPNKTEAARVRSFCRDALNYWQAKGIISGYKIETGTGANIEIILED